MKKKISIIVLLLFIILGGKITFSTYTSNTKTTTDLSLANFVVDAKKLDHIDVDLSEINPGDTIKYLFSVSNGSQEKASDVTIVYNIIVKTMHFMPINIELYDKEDKLIMNCDESYNRNAGNELVCMTDDIEMSYLEDVKHDYYLNIEFPTEYSSYEYASLIDYLNVQIKSHQKMD